MAKARKKSTTPVLLMGPPSDTASIRYLAGFEAPDPVLALWRGRGTDLLVSPLEAGRAQQCAVNRRGLQVHTAGSLGVEAALRGKPYAALLALLAKRRVTRVRVGAMFPAHAVRVLEGGGIAVEIEEGALFPQRAVKTAEEIGHIRRAQRAAVRAMRAATAMIGAARVDRRGRLRHGAGLLTSEAVRAVIDQVLQGCGCRGDGVIVAGGRQAVDPHERGQGPLRAGEAIVLDIFPRHERSGYWGDLTRTVARGQVSGALEAMYEAVAAAQAAALARIAPRAAVRAVHEAACAEFERRGFRTTLDAGAPEGFIHGTGHGVGLEIHEAPSLRRAPGRLRAGHCVTVEPGLYYRAEGGIRIEDTVEVTPGGARILAPMARRFRLDA